MIINDEQLKVVREQLSRAESALESLRRDVLPKNEKMYHVMAESYMDTIIELRGQIDSYMAINAHMVGMIEPASNETVTPPQ
jgi:hypothetical protein